MFLVPDSRQNSQMGEIIHLNSDYKRSLLDSLAPLDVDLAPGTTTTVETGLRPPTRSGNYTLCGDLVQRIADDVVPLPIEPVRQPVRLPPSSAVHTDA